MVFRGPAPARDCRLFLWYPMKLQIAVGNSLNRPDDSQAAGASAETGEGDNRLTAAVPEDMLAPVSWKGSNDDAYGKRVVGRCVADGAGRM
jgi:hypothetical protein